MRGEPRTVNGGTKENPPKNFDASHFFLLKFTV